MKKVVFTRVNPSTSECGYLAKPQDEKKWGAARLMGDKKKWLAVYDILKTSHVYSCSLSDYRGLKLGVPVVTFILCFAGALFFKLSHRTSGTLI